MIRNFCLGLSTAICMVNVCLAANPTSTLDEITDVGVERAKTASQSQSKIDNIHSITKHLESEYRHLVKVTDGIKVYNQVLQHQVDQQRQEIQQLQQGIQNAAQMERNIIPLLDRMVNSLESFVQLDVPFLITERNFRIEELKRLIKTADVSTAEKMRRVLQAYQIENDYGRTIEAYRDQIELNNQLIEADFLRIGRVSLMYQSLNAKHTGAWNQKTAQWVPMDQHSFQQNLKLGLQVANKQVAPNLLTVPLFSIEEGTIETTVGEVQ